MYGAIDSVRHRSLLLLLSVLFTSNHYIAIMVHVNFIFFLLSLLVNVNSDKLLPPKLFSVNNHRTQSARTNFQILCSVLEGSQPLFFEWSKNGQSIKSRPDVKYRIDNLDMSSTLSIKSIDRVDAGNYSCLVKNSMGSDSQTVFLIIKG